MRKHLRTHSAEYYDAQFTITQTRKLYDKAASGKGWKSKPTKTETKTITGQQYNNAISWLLYGDRVSYGYTYAGYLPVTITSISPNGEQKAVWSYTFTLK